MHLQSRGFPVKEAFCPIETYATWCSLQIDTDALRAMKTTSEEFCRRLGEAAFASENKGCMLINRILIHGEDIDVYNWDKIMWAYTTRCRPGHDEYIFEDVGAHPLTPYMSQVVTGKPKRGGKVVSDCLLRHEYDKPRDFKHVDFEHCYPTEVKDKVKRQWASWGFGQGSD